MHKTAAVIAAFMLVLGACSSSDDATSSAAPSPTTVIQLSPTATPPPPTPEPTSEPPATPSAEPTAATQPELSKDEQAVIAAWEKYVVLSVAARQEDPRPEALHYSSYAIGPMLDALVATEQRDRESGQFLEGDAVSAAPVVAVSDRGTATVVDCVWTRLTVRNRFDGTQLESFDESVPVEAGLELSGGQWLVATQEDGEHACTN